MRAFACFFVYMARYKRAVETKILNSLIKKESILEKNPAVQYTKTAISLHWLVAILFSIVFTFGWLASEIHGKSPVKSFYMSWHILLGVSVFWLVLLRMWWRATHPAPALPTTVPNWQRRLARATHILIYCLMILIPLTGYLRNQAKGRPVVYLGWTMPTLVGDDKDLWLIFKQLHKVLAYSLFGIVIAHVLAALYHHLIARNGVLARMLPFLKKGK